MNKLGSVMGVLVGMVAMGCSPAAEEPKGHTSAALLYDGPTLVRGIYFAEGPAASAVKQWNLMHPSQAAKASTAPSSAVAVTTLKKMATQLRNEHMPIAASNMEAMATQIQSGHATVGAQTDAQRSAVVTALVAAMDKKDAVFMKQFAKDIQSGNHVKVDGAFRAATLRLLAAATSIGSATTSTLGTKAIHPLDEGGGDEGGGDQGGGDPGGGDYTDYENSNYDNGGGDNGDYGNTDGDPNAEVQDAKLQFQVNVHVWYDTAAVAQNVAGWNNTLFWSQNDNGGIQTASFVDHLTQSFSK